MPTLDPNKDVVGFSNEIFNKELDPTRRIQERIWFRNILFLIGEQWIEFDITRNIFQRKFKNPYEPTPVDNIIREFCRAMTALLLSKDHKTRVWPNSNDITDKQASKTGEDFLEYLEHSNDEEFFDEIEKVTLWMSLAGTTFCRTFPMLERGMYYAIDNTGSYLKEAEVVNQNIMPFSVVVDDLGETLKQKRWVAMESLKSREWIEDTFHLKVTQTESETGHINYQKKLMKLIGSVSPWKGAGIEPQSFDKPTNDLCVLREIEFAPTKSRPNGRYVGVIGQGQKAFDFDKLPIPVEDNKWYYTFTDFSYYLVPGRFWADPGVNDQIHHQVIVNDIDQAFIKNRKGIGQPRVITTPELSIRRLNDQGSSFVLLEYDPLLSAGQKPEFQEGEHLPTQYNEERRTHVESSQNNSGDPKGVLRGKTPSAQASGVMVDILKEAAESSHSPDIKRFYRSKTRVLKKSLILARDIYPVEKAIKIGGSGTDIKVMNFKGADLRNNTDVRLEPSSGISTTNAGKTELLFNAADKGFFGDLTTDPETRQEFLTQLGLSGFKHKFNTDIDRAMLENVLVANTTEEDVEMQEIRINESASENSDLSFDDIIMQLVKNKTLLSPPKKEVDEEGNVYVTIELPAIEGVFLSVPNPDLMGQGGNPFDSMMVISDDPFFKYDTHEIHYEIHRRFILSDEFRALPKVVQDILMAHTDIHKMILDAQAQQQAQMALLAEQQGKQGGPSPQQGQPPEGII